MPRLAKPGSIFLACFQLSSRSIVSASTSTRAAVSAVADLHCILKATPLLSLLLLLLLLVKSIADDGGATIAAGAMIEDGGLSSASGWRCCYTHMTAQNQGDVRAAFAVVLGAARRAAL